MLTLKRKTLMIGFYSRGASLVFSGAFFAIAALISVKQAAGQTQSVDRAELLRTQTGSPFGPTVTTSGVDDGHAVASPNDPDLGEQAILKRVEEYQPFTIAVGSPFYWTSNVALANEGEQDDFLVAPSVMASYRPRITRTLYADFTVSEQLFYYDRFDSFNFGSFDAAAGLTYYLPQFHNLILHGGYHYNRLTEDGSFDDFYSNHSLDISAELPFRFGRAQQLSIGTGAHISLTGDPEPPRRNDFEVYIGYSVRVTRGLTIDAAGRLVVRDYYHDGRTDVTEILALSANYRVFKCLTASAISSFAANQSNHGVFDYEVANIGGAVALSIKF